MMFKNKTIDAQEIKKTILAAENRVGALKRLLPELDFSQRWELIGVVLPELDKTTARDAVRLFFSDDTSRLVHKMGDYRQRTLAIDCLGYLPSRETVEKLIECLSHQDDEVQISVAGALKNHTPRLVVPKLIQAMLADEITPARAGEVLLAMGYLAEEALIESYAGAETGQKAQILELLTLAENPKCLPFVPEALASGHVALRHAALEAVAVFELEECWPQVVDNLLDTAWPVRIKTLRVLERLALPETAEYIELLLDDEDALVRQVADECLCTIAQRVQQTG